ITAQSEIKTEKDAYNISKKRAKELKDLGITMNFSPVLDNIQKEDSFLYDRVFRTDISLLGNKMISGYTDGGVIAVPKHFPGHPDNSIDSHKTLPEVNTPEADFDTYASQFKEVLSNPDIQAIMVGHILFKQIDANNPSSLSSKIITEILRNKYGFKGVVITDDMQMGALTESLTIAQAAVKAVTAGNDLLIYSGEPEQQAEAYNAILDAVKKGKISEQRINESVLRILTLKANIFNL
ncbi:MAG TPA: glycoside hydrolase family 3 N-terminal domain-containing protein, partial [Candidatus Dojkabacteria bacterium]|nr:glycoside hydrolase family 3 N-terminal domain-containing protein [Candidatus Dojkabacteria bacterium]